MVNGETEARGINHVPKATELAEAQQNQNPGLVASFTRRDKPTAIRPCIAIRVSESTSGKTSGKETSLVAISTVKVKNTEQWK